MAKNKKPKQRVLFEVKQPVPKPPKQRFNKNNFIVTAEWLTVFQLYSRQEITKAQACRMLDVTAYAFDMQMRILGEQRDNGY